MEARILDWVTVLGPLLVSWPVAALLLAVVFRGPLSRLADRFTKADEGRAEVGPVKIELGRLVQHGQAAVATLNRLSLLMAESRVLELEITESQFAPVFSTDQQARMRQHIAELRQLIGSAKDGMPLTR